MDHQLNESCHNNRKIVEIKSFCNSLALKISVLIDEIMGSECKLWCIQCHANITTPLEQSNGKRIFLSCQRLFPFVDSQWPLCYHNLYCPNTTAVLNVWVRVQSWDMKCLQALKIPDTHTPASFPSLIPQPHSQVAPSFAARSVWSCDIKMLTVLTLRLHMYS